MQKRLSSNKKNINIITLGDSGVGKTAFINRFINNAYFEGTEATLGVELKTKVFKIEDEEYYLTMYDTCGQEVFDSITRNYYRMANAILLMFDLQNQESFKKVQKWYHEINENAKSNSIIILLGTKCDLVNSNNFKQDFMQNVQQYAKKNDLAFIQTSSKQNISIDEAVVLVSKQVIAQNQWRQTSQSYQDTHNQSIVLNNSRSRNSIANSIQQKILQNQPEQRAVQYTLIKQQKNSNCSC